MLNLFQPTCTPLLTVLAELNPQQNLVAFYISKLSHSFFLLHFLGRIRKIKCSQCNLQEPLSSVYWKLGFPPELVVSMSNLVILLSLSRKVRLGFTHRIRIKEEEKTKVVVAVWGTELIQFLATFIILHQDDLEKGMHSSYSSCRPGQFILFFKSFWCKIASAARI